MTGRDLAQLARERAAVITYEADLQREAGHELAHHGWTHRLPVSLSREEEEEESSFICLFVFNSSSSREEESSPLFIYI